MASLRPHDGDGGADQERAVVPAAPRTGLGDGGDMGVLSQKQQQTETSRCCSGGGAPERSRSRERPPVPSASGTSSHALSLLLRPRRGHSGPREAGASGRCSHCLIDVGGLALGGGACKGQKHLHGEFPAFAAVLAQWPQS